MDDQLDLSLSGGEDREPVSPRFGEKYRPSNGTEGEGFYSDWCFTCRRDAGYRDSGGDQPGCSIWRDALAFQITDDGYPRELTYGRDGEPRCHAYEEED